MSRVQAERVENSEVDVDAVNLFLEGGSEELRLKSRQAMHELLTDPVLNTGMDYYELTTLEHRKRTMEKIARFATYLEQDNRRGDSVMTARRLDFMALMDPQFMSRTQIALVMVLLNIAGNGTDAQWEYWLNTLLGPATDMRGFYGCFAMTELAHGLNVAGLETTATFDKAADEFVINTPHVGATKWWIGMAAHTATHANVYARLVVGSVDHGVKLFMVPLRDADHSLMPGVAVGDIGAKMGRHGIDNGWIQFLNVRIPRGNMLARYDQVSRDGTVTLSPLLQLLYAPLMAGRVQMVMDSFRSTARFATIAVRYAVGRRQFGESGNETYIMDYPVHQLRVLPHLAAAYVILASAHRLRQQYLDTVGALKGAGGKALAAGIAAMKELFVVLALLKATFTWSTLRCIDECRQCCGGHGYSAYSGFAKGLDDWVVQCTWEGDNTVLAMSAGRLVASEVRAVAAGKAEAKGNLAFVSRHQQLTSGPVLDEENVNDMFTLLEAFRAVVVRAALSNVTEDTAGELHRELGVVYGHTIALQWFTDSVYHADPSLDTSRRVLVQLAQLYACTVFKNHATTFVEHGVMGAGSTAAMAQLARKLALQVREHAVALTDAFMLPDGVVNLVLGAHDGEVNERYFAVVRQQNSPLDTQAPYAESVIKPFIYRAPATVRQRNERTEEVLLKLRR